MLEHFEHIEYVAVKSRILAVEKYVVLPIQHLHRSIDPAGLNSEFGKWRSSASKSTKGIRSYSMGSSHVYTAENCQNCHKS